ncbi:MAG: hypothetical protein R3F11_04775 [Verrucomicrobiales bacterium]
MNCRSPATRASFGSHFFSPAAHSLSGWSSQHRGSSARATASSNLLPERRLQLALFDFSAGGEFGIGQLQPALGFADDVFVVVFEWEAIHGERILCRDRATSPPSI